VWFPDLGSSVFIQKKQDALIVFITVVYKLGLLKVTALRFSPLSFRKKEKKKRKPLKRTSTEWNNNSHIAVFLSRSVSLVPIGQLCSICRVDIYVWGVFVYTVATHGMMSQGKQKLKCFKVTSALFSINSTP
jgi:hypothetical protein